MSRAILTHSLFAALLLAGCGAQTYEARLQQTSELFAYQNKLNENLSKTFWQSSDPVGGAVKMRVPKPFQMQARPQIIPPAAEGEPPTLEEDKRHPFFIGIQELPGLIDAWQGVLPIGGGQGMPSYLYVLGNHQRFIDKQLNDGVGPEPGEFLNDLETLLTGTLGVTLADDPKALENVKYAAKVPAQELYAVPKDFDVIKLVTPEGMAAQSLGNVPWRMLVYEHRAGPVQTAVLLLYPASATDKPDERLKLALETFTASDQPPRPPKPGEAATSGTKAAF